MPLTRDEDIAALLSATRTIAMVGASDRPDRPSYGVMKYLQGRADPPPIALIVTPAKAGVHAVVEPQDRMNTSLRWHDRRSKCR